MENELGALSLVTNIELAGLTLLYHISAKLVSHTLVE